jgi:translocation and assembly module TamB
VSKPTAKPRRRVWWKYLLIVTGVALVCILCGLWYLTTESFQNLVRRRMVAEVERITGGRAEMGSFHTVPFRMQVDVRNITIHGREAAGDVPLVHADRLAGEVKIISLLRTNFGFHEIALEHPVVHVVFYPDGTTNIPVPQAPSTLDKTSVDQLFALSIDHLYVRRGEVQWDDQKIPLDFDVHDTNLQADYSFLRSRYESHLLLGKVDTKFEDYRPFSWMTVVDFSLGNSFIDVKSLQWNSGRSHLQARGRISDFRHPQVDGSYDSYFDLSEVASIARRHDLREGVAEFKGQGSWSWEEFSTAGTLALRDLGWQDDEVAIKKANATSDYSVTDQQIKLSRLQGKLLGGSFSGDAQIENWLHSLPLSQASREDVAVITAAHTPLPKKKSAANKKIEKVRNLPGVQAGVVRLRVHDISDQELAVALNTAAHPLRGFRPAGATAGTLDAHWRGTFHDADVTFAFDSTPPAHSASGELPITAHAEGIYRGANDSLNLSQFTLSTPASHVQAAGALSTASALHFSIATSDLEEWHPLITALHGPGELPFLVDGNAGFNGMVNGSVSAPTVAGTLNAQDFEFTLPATSRTPEQQVHWDSLTTSIQFSSRNLAIRGGNLRRGTTSAEFDVTAMLEQGEFTAYSPFNARVNLHGVDVGSTAALFGYDYPITGNADFVLQITGTRAHPQAEGQIHAVNASAYGEAIAEFQASLRVNDGETALNNIHLVHDDATVTGSAGYNPSGKSFRLDLQGNNFDLARVRQIHSGRLSIEGRGDFTLKGSGLLDAPALNAQIHIRDLTLDHELLGGLDFDAATQGNQLRLKGQSSLKQGTLLVNGTVEMGGDYPANVSLHMDQIDLDAFWRSYLRGEITGHSAVAGELTMQGPLRDPRRWTLNGDLSELALDVEYAKVRNQDAVRFTYAEQMLHLDQLHLVGDGTDLRAHGEVHFAGRRELDLVADGHVDLKLLSGIDPDLTASGTAEMNMNVGGTISDPFPQGRLKVMQGAISYAGLPSGLSELNGSLTFTRDRFHIESLTAKTGGGTLDLKGDATAYNHQISFNLTGVGKGVRLRYPPGVSSTADAELHWVGTNGASTISGEIMVNKLAVTPNFDFSSYLERSRQISSLTPATSALYNVKLDIHVQTAPELQMKTAMARLSGDADLRLRGTAARPAVLGRSDILEGEATFNGTKFRLERGDITFANPVTIQPILNLEASTHVRNYDLAITVTGTPDQPGGLRVSYRSEPPLPQSDIIALLALGRTSEESEQLQQQSGQTPFTDEATALIINQAINSTVSSRLQKIFGVSRIKIDPQGLTTETNPTARGPQVTIEQQFANNVSLTYSTNVSQSSQQIIQGEYYFTRNVSAVGTRDQNGVVSFDVRIRRRKK